MRAILSLIIMSFLAYPAAAEPGDPFVMLEEKVTDLDQFIWEKRPIVVFADSPNDPNFRLQMEYLTEQSEALALRDVIVLTDTDPGAEGPLREILRPRGFMMVLIGKDGGVKLRKPFPWDVRELSRTIDKMPMRQREIRERRGTDRS